VTISFRKASSLIVKYNAGNNFKEEEIDSLMKWVEELREQLILEKKAVIHKKRVRKEEEERIKSKNIK
jgi:hypothetical protein